MSHLDTDSIIYRWTPKLSNFILVTQFDIFRVILLRFGETKNSEKEIQLQAQFQCQHKVK